jgi:WhiB family redox-sensing transcriptional regulator
MKANTRTNTKWRDCAACRDADPDTFFPIGESGPALDQIEEAKRICRICPVRAACLTWALDHQITHGIWGSTTAAERHVIRRMPRAITPFITGITSRDWPIDEEASRETRGV